MSTAPEIVHKDPLPYIGITREVTEGVPAVVDVEFPALLRRVAEQGIAVAAAPFIRTHEVDDGGEPLVIELGVPVAAEQATGELPAGDYVSFVHIGPYRSETVKDLEGARADVMAWIEEQGITVGAPSARGTALPCAVDHLLVGPPMESDWTKWRTEFAYLTT